MNVIDLIRKGKTNILVIGSHPAIIQSILDFDFVSGKKAPSILGIIASNKKVEKYFFGTKEVLLPCYRTIDAIPSMIRKRTFWSLNLKSGRNALQSSIDFFEKIPHALGGHIFAENVPEKHAIEISERFGKKYLIVGPSGVGVLVPGHLKLGAIGGVELLQIQKGRLNVEGSVAVISTSGGMTNELIRAVVDAKKGVSFAASIGGDRFPVASIIDLLTLAELDPCTKAVVYFGELGGIDEYLMGEYIKKNGYSKPICAYIAGVIDEAFDDHIQFGHAKALVSKKSESARSKREILRSAGASVPDTFQEFIKEIAKLPQATYDPIEFDLIDLRKRQKSILSTRRVVDTDSVSVPVKSGKIVRHTTSDSLTRTILEALLGKKIQSQITVAFMEAVFGLLIDHGGNVSGAVNTMITARAGKDMVSSLAAGLLTIGPRFGGAVNAAAQTWLDAVVSGKNARDLVDGASSSGNLIPGIGHRKYRVGVPDPRLNALASFTTLFHTHAYYDFARSVEKLTTAKNGNLILNIDGAIAALALDIFTEYEEFSARELRERTETEFFNACFIMPRSVGFIAHFMEQKKNDEGLFRLPDELIFERK